jgi:hypothetical protein
MTGALIPQFDAAMRARRLLGLPGVPGYARDGEVFWAGTGSNAHWRASGRPAFSAAPG